MSWGRSRRKRALDVVAAALLLVLSLPLMALAALAVRIRLGSPVLFRQQRPGLDGRPFWLVKFRSMSDLRDRAGRPLPDAARLDRFGRFLRRSSLDELPELLNVLHGEMSLVGPRPLLRRYLDRYTPRQARRHEVRPGLTGWAQVQGRNAVDWDERLEYDVWYVEHAGFWLDAKILVMTLLLVLSGRGVAAGDSATMTEFGAAADDPRSAGEEWRDGES